jgi:hypothetical protein
LIIENGLDVREAAEILAETMDRNASEYEQSMKEAA